MATLVHLEVPRNGHCFKAFQYLNDAGEPGDLTGATLSARAQSPAGDGTIIASAEVVATLADIGQFTIKWTGSDFDNFGELTAEAIANYDLKVVLPSGIIDVPMRGNLHIIPECTP